MTLKFEVYWSFRSPYSYLATPRLVQFAREHEVAVSVRAVRPLAVRDPEFFKRMDPLWRPYLFLDTRRQAEFLGLSFRRPVPDPIVQDLVSNEIAAEQPFIRDLTHLGIEAERRGRGLAFIDEVSRLLWGGAIDNWHQGNHLAGAARRAGLDYAQMRAAIDGAPERYDATLEANEAALRAVGHWGVPCFVFEGEPFFGQDRFETFVWRLSQNGLRKLAQAAPGHEDLNGRMSRGQTSGCTKKNQGELNG